MPRIELIPAPEIWEKTFQVTSPQKNQAANTDWPLPIGGACARKITENTTL